jgi:pilus assembly protein CpaB
MQNRLKIALVVAVFFGLVAAYGIYNFLRQQRQAAEALRTATTQVVVASNDIPAGATITEEMVKKGTIKTVDWPKASVPVGAFQNPKELVGKVNKTKILANEPVLESRLAGEGAGLTVRLEPGKRAMAISVNEIIGVSGFIVPDDRVDVILTTTPPGGGNAQDNRMSKIVLQNMRVLSVAQSTENKEGKPQVPRSITLEVTPEQAEKLSLASQEGSIILALRGVGDNSVAKTMGSHKRDLLAIAPRRVVRGGQVVQVPEKYKVEVIRGNDRKVVEF